MATEQFANNAHTTLDGGISNSANQLIVHPPPAPPAAFAFPAVPQFRIKIDDELMLVTGITGSWTWDVDRGVDGSTAATHSDGATVVHVLTAGALDTIKAEMFKAISLRG